MVALQYPTMTTSETSVLRVGFDDPFKPLAWSGEKGPEGPLMQMAARVIETAGFKATFIPLALQHSLAALVAGDVEALAYKAVVPDRAADLLFTMPLMTTGAALFALSDVEVPPRVLATPAKGPLASLLARHYPEARQILTDDYPGALHAVIAGQADAAALNVHVGWHWAEALYPNQFACPKRLIESLPLAMVVAKHRGAELRDRLDAAIGKLRTTGELHAIMERSGVPVLD